MIVPSRRWLIGAAILALIAPLALRWPEAALWLVVADIAWIMLMVIDIVRAAPVSIAHFPVSRETPPAFSVGRALPVSYHWSNPTNSTVHLQVREEVPRLLAADVLDERHLSIPRQATAHERREYFPAFRGKDRAGTLHLRVSGPWQLAWRQGRRALPWDVTVYPSLSSTTLRALPTQTQRRRDAGIRNTRRIGEGRLFESIKEWVPGDELRSVDWKATARRGKMMVRQYESERRQQVMMVIDAGRLLTAEMDGRARLEWAIDAALELAHSAVQHDDNVGLLVFADEVLQFVPPARGRRAMRTILDALASVQGRMVEPNYPAAFAYLASRSRKRALTVVFTDVVDRTASDAFVAQASALGPRHLPLIVTLRDAGLERAATTPADTDVAAFERAAAEELLEARDVALAELRQRGALVLDVAATGAARSVVTQYEMLKRRALV